jgi:hypothetical protein
MKNITTPRTLADCSFTTGYALKPQRSEPRSGWWFVAAVVAFCLLAFYAR